eukprot:TRINITY_DN718_c0_g1_i1.p1 TRINITY_DN718_c0_g1~~TRINITY_DN718_c0_g1_i1.p1  ORF type:complete len:282 (-),score=63.89 TRINITY_DN718_c0_g1_i1:54-899(-)
MNQASKPFIRICKAKYHFIMSAANEEWDEIDEPEDLEKDEFLSDLLQFFKDLKQPVRIVTFGPFGAGKSAFINTAATALSTSKRILKIAMSRDSSEHVTKSIRYYPCPGPEGNVILVDIPGFSDENYRQNQFEKILDGLLIDGMSPADAAIVSHKKRSGDAPVPIDAVILVVDSVDIVGNTPVIDRFNEIITMLMDRGLVPMIALNKMDKVHQGSKAALGQVYRDDTVRRRILQVSKETGLPVNQIFPVKSYYNEFKRRSDVEKLVLFCLKETIEANLERQ